MLKGTSKRKEIQDCTLGELHKRTYVMESHERIYTVLAVICVFLGCVVIGMIIKQQQSDIYIINSIVKKLYIMGLIVFALIIITSRIIMIQNYLYDIREEIKDRMWSNIKDGLESNDLSILKEAVVEYMQEYNIE